MRSRRPVSPRYLALTPHSLRRTSASIQCSLDVPLSVVMHEMGHTDAAFTLGVYAQVVRDAEEDRRALKDLVKRTHWTDAGQRAENMSKLDDWHAAASTTKRRSESGVSASAPGRI